MVDLIRTRNRYPNLFQIHGPKISVRDILAKSKLEYTLVCFFSRLNILMYNSRCAFEVGNGLFMDYLLPKGKKQYVTDFPSIPVLPEDRIARIPGDGNAPVTLTAGADIGRGVVWLLDQPHWDKYTYFRGENTTWNKVLQEAEEIVGDKFKVEYVSFDKVDQAIKDAEGEPGNVWKLLAAEYDRAFARGQVALPEGGFEKAEKRTSVRELLRSGYADIVPS